MFADIKVQQYVKLNEGEKNETTNVIEHKFNINGAWIRHNGQNLRDVAENNWYDDEHAEVMRAVYMLEDALKKLIGA